MFPSRRAGINHSFPDVTILTLPPYFLMTVHGKHRGSESSVQCWMPLFCDHRVKCLQNIKTGQYFASRTVWATGCISGTLCDNRLIHMPFFASPPGAAIAVRRNRIRGYFTVFICIPLYRNMRELTLQIVLAGDNLLTGTYRASCLIGCAGQYNRLPFVTAFPNPPNFTTAPCRYFLRLLWSVFY